MDACLLTVSGKPLNVTQQASNITTNYLGPIASPAVETPRNAHTFGLRFNVTLDGAEVSRKLQATQSCTHLTYSVEIRRNG
jgi:hypothetical protein